MSKFYNHYTIPMNLLILLIFVAVFVVFGLFKTEIKGFLGEKIVSSILYLLDGSKYKVVNNVVLNTGGRISQIDHLVVSDYGIFVIETKNYKGWIFGDENSEYWTQVLYKRKEKFYNPIRQNFGHILALKNRLGEFPDTKYIPIIVFLPKAKIKVSTSTEVTYTYKLLNVIRKHSTVVSLTENEKEKIFQKINSINARATYKRSQHVRSINQRIQKRENSIKEGRCPQCGDVLILRSGKFGRFLGCSSYPRCKFTKNI